MAEPISDSELAKVRSISQGGTRGEMHASVPIDVLASILARLERAEAKLPVLIETIRAGCRGRTDPDTGDSLWCLFCECEIASGDAWEHEPDCEGIAALKAAGEEP